MLQSDRAPKSLVWMVLHNEEARLLGLSRRGFRSKGGFCLVIKKGAPPRRGEQRSASEAVATTS